MSQRKLPGIYLLLCHSCLTHLCFCSPLLADFMSKNKEEKAKVSTNPFRGGWRHSLFYKPHCQQKPGTEIIQDLWNPTSNLLPLLTLYPPQTLTFKDNYPELPWRAWKCSWMTLNSTSGTQMRGTQPRLSRVSFWRDPKQISELGGEGRSHFKFDLKHFGLLPTK